jgi:UDP-N-acetylmuramoyl-L-alanyl-D-glutamate--2,6-diaminopimelate ligase
MYLNDLPSIIGCTSYKIPFQMELNGIERDSRKIKKGDLFVATKGTELDSHKYIETALKKGAVGLVIQKGFDTKKIPNDIAYCEVNDSSESWSILSQAFFNYPAKKMKMIAITGTSGKTSTAHIIAQMLNNLNLKTAVIGTAGILFGGKTFEYTMKGPVTTPDAFELNYLLSMAYKNGCKCTVIEASSHGLSQNRLYGMKFDAVSIISLANCHHVEYYNSVEDYIQAKEKLLKMLKVSGTAYINIDSELSPIMTLPEDPRFFTLSMEKKADYLLSLERYASKNICTVKNDFFCQKINIPLIGEFQAYNFTVALLICVHLGYSSKETANVLGKTLPIPGRWHIVETKLSIQVVIDKANTLIALKNIKKELLKSNFSERILVFGNVGGGKKDYRAQLGAFFSTFFNKIVLTLDDPENEDPEIAFSHFLSDLSPEDKKKVVIIKNRREAISNAIEFAKPNSVVAILGRGNQKEFIQNGEISIFDDIAETISIVKKKEELCLKHQ